jgi:LPS-assembly lipoprotein
MKCTSGLSGILPGGLDNEFSAARATVTATYVLKSASETGETVKSAAPALPTHSLIFHRRISRRRRAKLEAETRAARAGGSACPRRCCGSSAALDLQPV